MLYLKQYGYLEEFEDQNALSVRNQETVKTAIKDFQSFVGLSVTGELDRATISKMNAPRCGVEDKTRHHYSHRKKRYILQGSKWPKRELTYRIRKFPSRIRNRATVKKEFARASQIWSDVTTLRFTEKLFGPVDINIQFEVGYHGDYKPFDGPGGDLAHAFFPQYGGDAHFDDEEKWTINGINGINLLQVAAHEFGHSLGLRHSAEIGALMQPHYSENVSAVQLHSDDIEGIQALYGLPGQPLPPDDDGFGPTRNTGDIPDLCQDATIDAITRTKNGSTYVFKGEYYWEILSQGPGEGYPRKISDDWDGLPGNLDTAITWSNGRTFFFKERHYWRFTNKRMNRGYPKLISKEFNGIPSMLAAAFFARDGKSYFFKGDKFWCYDSKSESPVSTSYPKPTRKWSKMLSDGIDAAFVWENNRTYFFKGDQYYRYNDMTSEIDEADPPFPRSTAERWFNCQYRHNSETRTTERYRDEVNTIHYGYDHH